MKYLKTCPTYNANLKLHTNGETPDCSICKYWTKADTERLDSIMIRGRKT
jgi:hypothetical protein